MKNKKFFSFVMAALVSVSLVLVGCGDAEAGAAGSAGTPGSVGPATLPADATPELLAAYFGSTNKVFVVAKLGAGAFVVPAGKTLAVVGTVDITSVNTVINAFDGTLDVSAGGFTADDGNVFIVAQAAQTAVKAKVSNAIVPAYVASIPADPSVITEDVVLPGLTIGGTGGTTSAAFGTFAGSTHTVYVAGNLTVDATTAFNTGSAKIIVLGNTTAKGTLTVGATAALGKLTASGALTLTDVSNVGKLDTSTYTVTSGDTTVALDSLDSGTGGKLVLTGNVTQVDIDGGNGNVEFNTGAPAFATTASNFGVSGDVVFNGNVTVTGVAVTFNDTAFFANGVAVTLADGSSAITLAGTTGALAVGAPVANVPDIYSTVLIGNDASTGGTLTAGTANGTKLTFAATGITQDAPGANPHGITITGKVAVIPVKSYTVASESGKVGTLTLDTNAVLTLDAGVLGPWVDAYTEEESADWFAKLVLNTGATTEAALLKGAGSVVAGGTTIVGGTNGWEAVDSADATTIVIEADKITGGASSSFAATTGTDSVITVAAGATLSLGTTTVIDLKGDSGSAVGTIVLKGDQSGSGTDGGTLSFAAATTSLIKTAGASTKTSGTPTITGATLVGLTGAAYDSTGDKLTSLTSTADESAHTIQATANKTDVTLGAATEVSGLS